MSKKNSKPAREKVFTNIECSRENQQRLRRLSDVTGIRMVRLADDCLRAGIGIVAQAHAVDVATLNTP